jgi:hypothetical protein
MMSLLHYVVRASISSPSLWSFKSEGHCRFSPRLTFNGLLKLQLQLQRQETAVLQVVTPWIERTFFSKAYRASSMFRVQLGKHRRIPE